MPERRHPVPEPRRAAGLAAKLDALAGRVTDRLIRATPLGPMDVQTAEPVVSFTFDDVPDTALTAGADVLEAHDVRGTFYVAGGLEGRIEPERTLIGAQGCRDLAARGHEIGCHTFSHRALRHTASATLKTDLARNARYLDAVGPRSGRRNFAFPYNGGSLGKRGLLEATFRTCRAGGEAINRGPTDPAFLRAVEIRQPEAHVHGLTGWVDALVAKPGWLIFFTHDISPTPTPFGCTREAFERLVAYAIARGCRVLPVDAALDHQKLRMDAR